MAKGNADIQQMATKVCSNVRALSDLQDELK
jgi:hypothetical protein